MKKLILLIVVVAIAAPCRVFAIEEFKRTGEIETDKSGGYSESQRDPHARRAKQVKEKTGAGYYQGEYHNTSPEYRPGEWQFVDPSSGKSQPKKYKKVQETDKPQKSAAKKNTSKSSGSTEKAKSAEPTKAKSSDKATEKPKKAEEND